MTFHRRPTYPAVPSEGDPAALLAHPKPQYVPEGQPVDKSSLPLAVGSPTRDRDFLSLVRGEVCAVNASFNHECGGVTEAAHLEVHGKSVKGDDHLTAPLCTIHHRAQHSLGIVTFQINYGVNLWEVNARLQARHYRMRRLS